MSRYCIQNFIDERYGDDERYRAHVERSMKRDLAEKLVDELPLDEPTMVRMQRDEQPDYRTRSMAIRYAFELRACRSMDQIVMRPVYRDPEPEIRYVDRVVYIEKPKPPPPPPRTGWQKFCDFLDYIAPEVKYDGGYGNP